MLNLESYRPLHSNEHGMYRNLAPKNIVIHCSASRPGSWISDAQTIDILHRDEFGWSGIGYHYVITRSGEIQQGRRLDRSAAAARGHNNDWHVCLIGGLDSEGKPTDAYEDAQWSALEDLVKALLDKCVKDFGATPGVLGHNDLTALKVCPCFNVKVWWANILKETWGAGMKADGKTNKFPTPDADGPEYQKLVREGRKKAIEEIEQAMKSKIINLIEGL